MDIMMKKNILWIVGIVCTVLLFTGAYFLYSSLSKTYAPDKLAENQTDKTDNSSNGASSDYAAPDFTVSTPDGKDVKLSDYLGKPVVLNFWATWCYYCKEEMPDFNQAYQKYPDVQFLMVNATDGQRETEQIAKDYVAEQGFTFPVFFDKTQQAVSAYYISGLPATFFIDRNGNLVTYANGMLDAASLEKGIQLITGETND